jgi:signal transduction histidine kinase
VELNLLKWIAIICCNILIVENAIKYNHSGGQVIVEAYQKEKQVYLSVEDTGSGIPEELKERVFEPFFRVDKSRSRELGGVGLGLCYCINTTYSYVSGRKVVNKPVG